MQKFGLLFLAVSTALLGLVDRETNAERFARGMRRMPPLPPRAASEREGVTQYFLFNRKTWTTWLLTSDNTNSR